MRHEPENPLLNGLGHYIDIPDWPERLERNPLDGFPKDPTPADRADYLSKANKRFAATREAIRIAYDIQSMIRASYIERNPCLMGNRRKIYDIAKLEGKFSRKTPIFYSEARCKLIKGILGLGKSRILKRALSAFPKMLVHGSCSAAGWMRHTQITHLIAKMSADGSRNGLLVSILAALDEVAGTDYFHEIGHRRMTVESRMLETAKVLACHSVGLLAIEEMQAENFIESKYRKELRLFFLGILSFGIPMVLVGNPRAFTSIGEFKQTESRFLSVNPSELWPCHDYKDPDWLNAIAPAIWNYQVVERAEPFSDDIAKALWECSGGIPRYARQLVSEAQTSVLIGAAPALTERVLREHYKSLAAFRQFGPLIEGLVTFDVNRLIDSRGEDIPVDLFEDHWRRLGLIEAVEESSEPQKQVPPATGDYRAEKKKQLARKKAATTRKANKQRKNKELEETLSTDDLRYRETHKDYLVRSLETLRSEIESEEK
jgi:hypothetical protein